MPSESGIIVCPNPKCQRKIEELILLSDLSTTPAKQYHACPHCFTEFKVISTQPQRQEEKKKNKEEPPSKAFEKKEKGPSRCAGYLGYLACIPKNKPIPQECLICPKVLECAMKVNDF